jgi:hypothetical protein
MVAERRVEHGFQRETIRFTAAMIASLAKAELDR